MYLVDSPGDTDQRGKINGTERIEVEERGIREAEQKGPKIQQDRTIMLKMTTGMMNRCSEE